MRQRPPFLITAGNKHEDLQRQHLQTETRGINVPSSENNKMKRFRTILFLAILVLTQSCLDDDYSDCPDGITVRLYHDALSADFVLPATDRASLFVFDADGIYRKTYTEGIAFESNNEHFMNISLFKGGYKLIGFRGLRDCYANTESFQEGVTTLDEALFYLAYGPGAKVTQSPHHLFSSVEIPVNIVTRSEHIDVYMPLLTNIIRVRTVGLPSSADDFAIEIRDNNSHYKFDNSFVSECPTFDYTTACARNAATSQLSGELVVMRLTDGRSPILTLRNTTTGEVLFPNEHNNGNLVAMICSALLSVDFETTHLFEVELRFDANMDVSVSINGWAVVDDGNDL